MHGVELWIGEDGIVRLHGTSGARGRISPAALRAHLLLRDGRAQYGRSEGCEAASTRVEKVGSEPGEPGLDPRAGVDLHHMITVAAAVLVGRLGKVFVHAAGLVGPDGRAWLLVGDAGAGKSSTAATLVAGAWDWLADDRVLLDAPRLAGPPRVQGWARPFRLDTGWASGVPSGTRRLVNPAALGPGRRRREAPLGGLLFPRVEPKASTELRPVSAGDALTKLVRQSPWLFLDPPAAPALLRLLARAANVPAFALRLGEDVYAEPERLGEVLMGAGPGGQGEPEAREESAGAGETATSGESDVSAETSEGGSEAALEPFFPFGAEESESPEP